MEVLTVLTQIQRELSAIGNRPRPAIMYYLSERPPYAQANYPDGNSFKIGLDGGTLMRIAGMDVPVAGCPCPEVIWRLNTGFFAWKYRRLIPLAVLTLVGLAALQFLLLSIPGAPSAVWLLDYFAGAMNAALVTLFLLCIVAAALWNFRRGVHIRLSEPDEIAGLLEMPAPDISPDVLVMSASPDETPERLLERIRDAKNDQLPGGQYLLFFTFRSADGLIVRSPEVVGESAYFSQMIFDRAHLTKDIAGWSQEVSAPRMFERETWTEFVAYVRAFCVQFADWSRRDKMRQGNPYKNMTEELRARAMRAASFLLPLLFAFNLNAQDLQPVSARPIPENGGKSIFQSLPDSAKLEAYKMEMLTGKMKAGKEIAPRLDFAMWVFHNFAVPILFFVGLLALFVAKASFKEALHDQSGRVIFGHGIAWYGHQARAVVFVVAILIALAEISHSMVVAFFTSESLWWAAIQCVALSILWYFFVTWITPNPKVNDGAEQTLKNGAGNNYPRIG